MKKVVTGLALAGLLAGAGFAAGQPQAGAGRMGPGGRPGFGKGGAGIHWILRNPEAAKELGLTDQQITALRESSYKTRKEMIKLRADLQTAQLELDQLMQQDAPAEGALSKAIDEIGRIKTQIQKTGVLERVRVQQLLGKDTVAQIKESARKQWRERRGDRRGEGRACPFGPRSNDDQPGPGREPPDEDVDD